MNVHQPVTGKWINARRAFTLVEIMIVVALVGLLAALSLPSFSNARKKSQGERIVNDARVIDTCVETWAIDNNLVEGTPIDLTQAAQYSSSGSLATNDILGNPFLITTVGTNQVRIANQTKTALAGVPIDWGAY